MARVRPGHDESSTEWAVVPEAVVATVYTLGVVLWAAQPQWLTRQPLLPGLLVTFVVAAVLGLISGRWRSIAAPLLFGLAIGAISAATANGDLGRAGEFVICAVWGAALAAAAAAGIVIRHQVH